MTYESLGQGPLTAPFVQGKKVVPSRGWTVKRRPPNFMASTPGSERAGPRTFFGGTPLKRSDQRTGVEDQAEWYC